MNPEQLKKLILTIIEGLEQKIESLSGEISTVKKTIPNVDKTLARIKPRLPIYGKDWKLTREEIEQIAEKIKPIAGRDFTPPKDGKDAVITEALIAKITKMVQSKVRDGRDGKDGARGEDGEDGLDGSPDEPKDIVKKLNTVENALDWKVLKNFNSLVNQDTLKRAIDTLENQTRYLIQRAASTTSNSGVSSFNTLTGAVTISAGTGITLTPSGNDIQISATGSVPAAPDTSIQFNDGGVFGGDADFVWNKTNNTMTISTTKFFSPTNGSIVIGEDAGNYTMTGEDNLIFGGNSDGFEAAGVSLTTGDENIFMGKGTGRLMTSAARNVIIGSNAGSGTGATSTVSDNVIIGRGTGTGLGLASGTAVGNVLIGQGTGTAINANYNIAIGYQAMGNSTGQANIAIGPSALASTTSGNNIGIGDSVGQSITTGTGNILIGSIAGNSLVAGSSNNTIIGYQAGTNNEGYRNTFVGSLAGGFPLGNDNTAIGYNTFNASGSGLDQTIQGATVLGSYAMTDPRTGSDYTTAIGFEALKGLTTGGYNTALGANAGDSLTTGSYNTLLGANAGAGLTLGIENTMIGLSAGTAITGAQNITSGNVIMGMYTSVLRTQGNFNTIVGTRADSTNASTGDSNTILGYSAGGSLTTGASNIMIGAVAGYNVTTAQGIFIGVGADSFFNGVGMIALGSSAVTTASNQMVVGSTATPVNNYFFGSGVTSATPTDITFNAGGGSGTDIAGADYYINGGRPTGAGAPGEVLIQTAPTGASGTTLRALETAAKFDATTTTGNTRFFIYDVDNGTLERVTVGAADSGGTGFKLLRIAN